MAMHLLTAILYLQLVHAIVPRLPARPVQIPAADIPARPAERPNALNLREEVISGGVEAAISLLGQEVFPTATTSSYAGGFSPRPTTGATGLFTFDNGFDSAFSVVGRQLTDFDSAFTDCESASTDFDSAFTDFDSPTPSLTFSPYSWPTITIATLTRITIPTLTLTAPPTPPPTFIPSCPRAQVYLNYCAHWYGSAAWSTLATQAYCLCLGPALATAADGSAPAFEPSSSASLVYVPDIFDGDAVACAEGYVVEAAFWGGLFENGTVNGDESEDGEDGEDWGMYSGFQAEALRLAGEWEGALGFCAVNGDGGGGVEVRSSVPPEYFLGGVKSVGTVTTTTGAAVSEGVGDQEAADKGEDGADVQSVREASGAGAALDRAVGGWRALQIVGFVAVLLSYCLVV